MQGPGADIAIGVFISQVPRRDFDYDDLDWGSFLEAKSDFDQGKRDHFRVVK
jgi:hypothetical protein